MTEKNACGCKPRKISKGLLTRVGNFIRDKSVDGICVKSIADIADEMGLLLPTIVVDALAKLEEKGTIKVKERGQELTDRSAFIYIGDDEVSKLMSNAVLLTHELGASLGDNPEFQQLKQMINEMVNILDQQNKEVIEYHAFKSGVVKQIEAQEGVYHIISKTRLNNLFIEETRR
ncbi:hypothetical protein [Desulforamulus aeronauticus]|uniref:Uncharacterized protein n=1 Tax=Desulforamulus aeronauticus DSM 10349 TaxID=1121421 RepID=A0A1M6SPQ2_9FIRM|nr:hypothetical protein [Desulforamulus aeronauticus]SHK46629.1 hypothetical protein SAMN02745123_01944 [Desulforamulus aeronauticus DSM 10349]